MMLSTEGEERMVIGAMLLNKDRTATYVNLLMTPTDSIIKSYGSWEKFFPVLVGSERAVDFFSSFSPDCTQVESRIQLTCMIYQAGGQGELIREGYETGIFPKELERMLVGGVLSGWE